MANTNFRDAIKELDDRRIKGVRPLVSPELLMEEYPLSLRAAQTVLEGRRGAEAILKGEDDRLLVVVGPCSVHDVQAGLEYSRLLQAYAEKASDDLHILMRVYFEKPRTTVGWKGLINDPNLNGTFQINKGLRLARGFLLELASVGLPTACEFLDTISPQYTADLVSWGAIGARTTESQIHRELASGLSMPVGFKNGTDGSVDIAIDAIRASQSGHVFLSVTKKGLSAIVETQGNDATHVILRGGAKGPNYDAESVKACTEKLSKAKLPQKVMVDCSHGNSLKQHKRQVDVANDISVQLASEATGNNIFGVMIESNLVEGNQKIPAEGPIGLTYGQSVTDACIDWQTTVEVLETLRKGVRARRARSGRSSPHEFALEFNDIAHLKPGARTPRSGNSSPRSRSGFSTPERASRQLPASPGLVASTTLSNSAVAST